MQGMLAQACGLAVALALTLCLMRFLAASRSVPPTTAPTCPPRSVAPGSVGPPSRAPRPLSICVLILSVDTEMLPSNEPASQAARWREEKAIWRLYMHTHPAVTCRFVECGAGDAGDVLYCPSCTEAGARGATMWKKTSAGLRQLDLCKYDYIIRPNLNTFVIFEHLLEYLSSFPFDPRLFTGKIKVTKKGLDPTVQYPWGCAVIFGRDCARALASDAFIALANERNRSNDDVCFARFLPRLGFRVTRPPTRKPLIHVWTGPDLHWNSWLNFNANALYINSFRVPFVRTKHLRHRSWIQAMLLQRYYPNPTEERAEECRANSSSRCI